MNAFIRKLVPFVLTVCFSAALFGCAPKVNTLEETSTDATATPVPTQIVASRAAPTTVQVVKVTGDGVNVRAAGDAQGEILGQADQGAYFFFTATEGDWNKIVYDDKVGFVSTQFSAVEQVPSAQATGLIDGTAQPTVSSTETSTKEPTSSAESTEESTSSASSSLNASDIRRNEDGQRR